MNPHQPVLLSWALGNSMHYYQFHVSDYIHDTAHLSIEEDLAFRRLLDLYYTQEKPIPNRTHEIARRIRMAKHEDSIQIVLEEFFQFDMENDCWRHNRCDETILAYQAKSERNRVIGKLGGRPKANHVETQTVTKNNPNHKPLTKNQEPLTSSKTTRGSRLSIHFEPDFDFAKDQGIQDCKTEFDKFKDYWMAQGGARGVKLDWQATWRNWCRSAKKTPASAEPAWRTEQRQRTQIAAPGVAAYEPEFFNGVTHDNAPRLG
jgi:uncharacterized protein YdaU (DUF1376 family)